ncbi:MAG: class I SAM-dependent methyltransferase [Tepidiformaceae bacterium]
MSIDPYAADAAFYDAIHDGERDDIGLWLSFAGRTDRPVLEVGCGTGRIAVELAKAGHAVVGLDPSREMLARARTRCDEFGLDVEWHEGTLLDLAFEPGRFGFVLVPADVFLYCQSGEEQLAWLRALTAAMHFNGRLTLDLPGPALSLDAATNAQQLLTFSGEGPDGQPFDAWQVKEDDLAAQARWLRVTYEQVDNAGTVRRQASEHQLRYVYRFEMEYLLALAGLAQLDVYGDYDLGPLTNDSERMIIVARRVEG